MGDRDDDLALHDAEDMEAYNLVEGHDDLNLTSSAETLKPKLRPGDHVWMWCNAIGGIRYQHHGILIKVVVDNNRMSPSGSSRNAVLHIADFTAPDESTFALPTSIASGSTAASGRLPSWHGLRVTTYHDASEWHKQPYENRNEGDGTNDATNSEDEENDNRLLALRRVRFLLRNPHLLPEYEILESNCETAAAWCKTGAFHASQVRGLLDGGERNSLVVTGAAAAAAATLALGPLALPMAMGAGVSWSVVKFKRGESEVKWRERTSILNREFEKWSRGQDEESGKCIVS